MDRLLHWIFGALVVLLIALMILSAVAKARERDRCNARGGVYIEYQCVNLTTGRTM